MNWIANHPELVAMLALSLLSFVAHLIEPRAPRLAAAIRAAVVDVPGLVRAIKRPAPAEPVKVKEGEP